MRISKRRALSLARAAIPPRLVRRYRTSTRFRSQVNRALRWSWVPVLAHAFVFTDNGLAAVVVRLVRIRTLEREVAAIERRNAWLESEIARRKDDPATIERLARERYGMARPDETVYRIVEVSPGEARRIEREKRRLEKEAAANEAATREAAAASKAVSKAATRRAGAARRDARH